jgi:hypothetical protein
MVTTSKEKLSMKRFLMAIALASVFSVTTLAGEIPSGGFTAPPPDGPPRVTAPGDVPSVGLTQQVSEAALTLVQLILGSVV